MGHRLSLLLPELDQVIVYRWALTRVDAWMEEARGALYERRVDKGLRGLIGRIVRELDKLIGAIEQTRSMPAEAEFSEAELGAEGGGGSPAATKPVPTMAELLVLRAMQVDINERTAALKEGHGDVSEDRLRRIGLIGEDQIEVRRLTKMLTDRARRP